MASAIYYSQMGTDIASVQTLFTKSTPVYGLAFCILEPEQISIQSYFLIEQFHEFIFMLFLNFNPKATVIPCLLVCSVLQNLSQWEISNQIENQRHMHSNSKAYIRCSLQTSFISELMAVNAACVV